MPPKPSVPLPVHDFRNGLGGDVVKGGIPQSIPAGDRKWSTSVPGGGGQAPYHPTKGDVRPDGKLAHGVMLTDKRGGGSQAFLHYRDPSNDRNPFGY